MTAFLRYWGWFALKIAGATAVTALLYAVLRNTLFRMEYLNQRFDIIQFTFDGVLFGFFILPMVWVALVVLAVRDQRIRCRVCGRKLRMPLTQGSYSALLLDHPGLEYVCPYGHGKLLLEYWVAVQPEPKWTKYGNIWQELFRSGRE